MISILPHLVNKIKLHLLTYKVEFGISLIIALVGFSCYFIGVFSRFNVPKEDKIEIRPEEVAKKENTEKTDSQTIVASKNGKKYYFTWCSGASRISSKNRVYFNSTAEARARGLTADTHCMGLD